MKTIEEKAKAYDEALEKAKKLYEKGTITESLNYVFPELAESKDEKIRKELIEHIKANKWADYVLFQKFSPDDVIAWLEKQESVEEIVERCKTSWYNEGKIAGMAEGLSDEEKYQQGWHDALKKQGEKPQGKTAFEAIKEKPVDNANKVEPKFKVGDWIVEPRKGEHNCIWHIDRIEKNSYWEGHTGVFIEHADKYYHLWTIKDAKDGDVLYSLDSNQPFIYKERNIHEQATAYCGINKYGKFFVWNTKDCIITLDKYIPATKEQRDALMKAMADAGWQFDFDKKELKKKPKFKVKYAGREYNVLETKESVGVTFYGIEDEPNHIDYVLSDDCEIISGYGVKEKGNSYPTKSATFSEQNPAWSEEDECYMAECISAIATKDWSFEEKRKTKHWLKSLKDRVQPHWKPSGEQIDAFEHFVKSIGESGFAYPHNHNTKCVYSLLNDLKKL